MYPREPQPITSIRGIGWKNIHAQVEIVKKDL